MTRRRETDHITYDDYVRIQAKVSGSKTQHATKYNISEALNAIGKNGNILDVGCRGAELLRNLKNKGFKNVYGLDIGNLAVPRWNKYFGAAAKTNFKVHDIHAGNPFNVKFDLVILSHVLEHFWDIDKGLGAIKDALNDGGWLFIAVPPGDHLPEEDVNQPAHFYFWPNEASLVDFMKERGFECQSIHTDKFGDMVAMFRKE